MEQAELLPFYQQFYSESLFILPDSAFNHALAHKQEEKSPVNFTTDNEIITGDTPLPKKFNILGENKKGLVLVFSLVQPEFAALPKNVFLTKILSAIQHSPTDVAYVNLEPGYKVNIFDLSKDTKLQQVVAFGPDLIDLAPGTVINPYKPAAIGQIPLLLADPVHQIENDVNRKKYLWSGLQAIFLK